ncbi:MAG: GntR family transcriptional regulator [bacterium]|nr:GntR family transcriptional regulator [bacterium]
MSNIMNIAINNNCDLPISNQIAEELRKRIVSNELKPGEAMPSIHALARTLHISVNTTKQAYDILEKEQLIHTLDDEVSFVTDHSQAVDKNNELSLIKEQLKQVASTAKTYQIPIEDVVTILKDYYEENRYL